MLQPQINSERQWNTLTDITGNRYSEAGRAQVRDYMIATLEAAGWSVHQQLFRKHIDGQTYTGVNVIADSLVTNSTEMPVSQLPDNVGTSSSIHRCPSQSKVLLVGAHYDTVIGSPGADDNASGVSALLELAQTLSPQDFSVPLKLVLFDLEEAGLWGSEAFVADASESQCIDGAIILEMLGYQCQTDGCQQYPALPITPPSSMGDFLAVVGDRDHPNLVEAFRLDGNTVPIYTLSVPATVGLSPDLWRSDHVPFWRQGIGAVMVTDTANFRNPHYHQGSDRPDTLTPEFLFASTQAVINAVIQLTHAEGCNNSEAVQC